MVQISARRLIGQQWGAADPSADGPAASFKGISKFKSILCFNIIQAVAANPSRWGLT
jgi:hypothetical protein